MQRQILKGSLISLPRTKPADYLPRFTYFFFAVLILILIDIPICRLDYHWKIASDITVPKQTLLQKPGLQAGRCKGLFRKDANAYPDCKEICDEVEFLAKERQRVVLLIRDRHWLGGPAGEFFDGSRGGSQDENALDKLFETRDCERVLQSVDKSNGLVNGFCYFLTFVSMAVAIQLVHKIIEGPEKEERSLEQEALNNFAKFYDLPADETTKALMVKTEVSLHVWAILDKFPPPSQDVIKGIATPKAASQKIPTPTAPPPTESFLESKAAEDPSATKRSSNPPPQD
jgi:hypothetical protein